MMKSACFTGYRNLSGDIAELSQNLYKLMEQRILYFGLTNFYSGGAIGFDTLAAQIVLKLREIYP